MILREKIVLLGAAFLALTEYLWRVVPLHVFSIFHPLKSVITSTPLSSTTEPSITTTIKFPFPDSHSVPHDNNITTTGLTYQILYYNNTLDHLAPFYPPYPTPSTFSHRYLLNDTYFGDHPLTDGCRGPIFLYTGNEAAITDFWDGNGFMQYLTVKYGGLLVFPEERYYGESLPTPQADIRSPFLTTQQVLEDYVELLTHVKSEYQAESCPTIAFGGSYGGTLAAFIRSSYPFAVQGALASSSELGYYDLDGWSARGITEYTFSEIIAAQYNNTEGCLEAIWDASDLIDSMVISDDDDYNRTVLLKTFNFCNVSALLPYPSSVFIYGLEGLPQLNYPYSVDGRPAWPVQAVCEIMIDTSMPLLDRAASVTAISMQYTLDGDCLPTLEEGPGNIPGDGPGSTSWGFQSCTETIHRFSSIARHPKTLGLRNYDYNLEIANVTSLCQGLYQVVPNTDILKVRYGGFDIARTTSNTIFSSGRLDPWGGAAISTRDGGDDASDRGVYFFSMPNGAHHLDLKGWNDADPKDVIETRCKEEAIILGWIKEWVKSDLKEKVYGIESST